MNPPEPNSNDLDRKIRTLLASVCGYPASFEIVLREAKADPGAWIPRLVQLGGEGHDKVGETANKLLLRWVSTTEDVDLLLHVYQALPYRTTHLAEVGVCVTERLLARFSGDDRLRGREAAILLNNLSVRCRENDQPDLALQSAEIAVQVAGLSPGDAEDQRLLVKCLLTRACALGADGQHAGALASADQACSILGGLSQNGTPDAELEILVGVNRANRLFSLGRQEEAIAGARAVRVKLLAHLTHPGWEQTLAFVEMTLANGLSASGRYAEALPHAEAADRMFRTQFKESPVERLEYTAAAANSYADALIGTDQAEAAKQVLTQAVLRIEPFVRRRRPRFGSDLGILLMSLADAERTLGNLEEAVRQGKRALAEIQSCGRRTRRRDWKAEGTAANNLFLALYQLGRWEEADKFVRRALHCFRKLPDTNPEARAEIARALHYLAQSYLRSTKRGAAHRAVQVARRAVDFASETCGSPPAVLLLSALCHSTLGLCLEARERLGEALGEARTAVDILRRLDQLTPGFYQADVAYSACRLSHLLVKLGDYPEGKAAAREAIGLYEPILQGDRDERRRYLADSLLTLGEAQLALQELPEAVVSLESAIRVLRPGYGADPLRWLPWLLPICLRYVQVCENLGMPYQPTLVEDVIQRARAEQAEG